MVLALYDLCIVGICDAKRVHTSKTTRMKKTTGKNAGPDLKQHRDDPTHGKRTSGNTSPDVQHMSGNACTTTRPWTLHPRTASPACGRTRKHALGNARP